LMDDTELNTRLHEICDRFFASSYPSIFPPSHAPPFDISKPNLHDSKGEFLAEVEAVDKMLSEAASLMSSIRGAFQDEHPQNATLLGIANAVDRCAEDSCWSPGSVSG
jgi:hypothetical protein